MFAQAAAVALVPVLLRSRTASLAAAAALTLLAFLGLASVGIFLVPTVVLAWVAARTTPVAPAAWPAPVGRAAIQVADPS